MAAIERRDILDAPKSELKVSGDLYPALVYCLQLHDDYYSPGYLMKNWLKETEAWQLACVLKQTMSPDFINKWWDHFPKLVKELCIRFQELDPTFLKTRWHTFSGSQSYLCYKYQTVPEFLITRDWTRTTPSNQLMIIGNQYLSMNFILHIWCDLPVYGRLKCFQQQKMVDRISVAELPIFLVDGCEFVRKRVINSTTEEVNKW